MDNLKAETHELGGSTVVVDRATPKAIYSTFSLCLTIVYLLSAESLMNRLVLFRSLHDYDLCNNSNQLSLC